MLENLTSKIRKIVSSFSNTYKITDFDIKDILKRFRKSFIEADVSWDVTKAFLNNVRNKSVGLEVTKKISPGNLLLKIINDELVNIISLGDNNLNLNKSGPTVIMLIGLQGVGKTTTCVKLANFIRNRYKKSVVLTSSDTNREAAIKQLKDLSISSNIDFFDPLDEKNAINIANSAIKYFNNSKKDVLLFDTAGRLHVNNYMLDELKELVFCLKPTEILLVVDGMTGQDAVNSTKIFNNYFDISGFIVTKMDGDSRGGVILSITYLTRKNIKFICYGEAIDCINIFYPNRIVSRILGMGDLDTLIEDVNKVINKDEANLIVDKIKRKEAIDLNIFKIQLEQILKMGGMESLISKIPGMHSFRNLYKKKLDDKYFVNMLSVINSMTNKEKKYPHLINGSRKRRIASGSGTSIQIVNSLLKQFNNMKKVYTKSSNIKNVNDLFKKKFNYFK